MKTHLKINNDNTVNFKEDIEYLLFTLRNLETTMNRHKDKFSYDSLIWTTAKGYWLTFQAFNKTTGFPTGHIYHNEN